MMFSTVRSIYTSVTYMDEIMKYSLRITVSGTLHPCSFTEPHNFCKTGCFHCEFANNVDPFRVSSLEV